MDIDYYEVLGVPRTASSAVIKQRYRVLSKKYHPDVNGGDDTAMAKLNEAYTVLSNPSKRTNYNFKFDQQDHTTASQDISQKPYTPTPFERAPYKRPPSQAKTKRKKRIGIWPLIYLTITGIALFTLAFFVGALGQPTGNADATLSNGNGPFVQTTNTSYSSPSAPTEEDVVAVAPKAINTPAPNTTPSVLSDETDKKTVDKDESSLTTKCRDKNMNYSKRTYSRCYRHSEVSGMNEQWRN